MGDAQEQQPKVGGACKSFILLATGSRPIENEVDDYTSHHHGERCQGVEEQALVEVTVEAIPEALEGCQLQELEAADRGNPDEEDSEVVWKEREDGFGGRSKSLNSGEKDLQLVSDMSNPLLSFKPCPVTKEPDEDKAQKDDEGNEGQEAPKNDSGPVIGEGIVTLVTGGEVTGRIPAFLADLNTETSSRVTGRLVHSQVWQRAGWPYSAHDPSVCCSAVIVLEVGLLSAEGPAVSRVAGSSGTRIFSGAASFDDERIGGVTPIATLDVKRSDRRSSAVTLCAV